MHILHTSIVYGGLAVDFKTKDPSKSVCSSSSLSIILMLSRNGLVVSVGITRNLGTEQKIGYKKKNVKVNTLSLVSILLVYEAKVQLIFILLKTRHKNKDIFSSF
jgi:hypothetical protein